MAIKRDYNCRKHGFFEAWEAVCPQGCTTGIKIALLKAPGMISGRTKSADQTVKGLAQDFGMTNLKSTREGEHQEGYLTRNNAPPPEPRPGAGVIWGGDSRYSMQNVLAGGAVRSVRGESVGFNPQEAGNLRGPQAASFMQDHEGLKVKS
jgi:hypothetical protein